MSRVPGDRFFIQIAAVDNPSGGAAQLPLHDAVTATDIKCGKCCLRIEAKAAEVLAKNLYAPFHPEVVFRRHVIPLFREIPAGGIVVCHYTVRPRMRLLRALTDTPEPVRVIVMVMIPAIKYHLASLRVQAPERG